MPECLNCGTKQSKLNCDNLCKNCNTPTQQFSQQQSNSYTPNNQQMDQRYHANNYQNHNTEHDRSNAPVTVNDLTRIIKPLQDKMDNIDTYIRSLDTRVKTVENELKKEISKNEHLTEVIINMQKALNKIDSKSREANLMISGCSEDDIHIEEDVTLTDDKKKLTYLLNSIGITDIPETTINNFEFTRIGTPSNNRIRLLKVFVKSKELRERICKESSKVKNLNHPWRKIYINRDAHPVYLKENQRLRKKMKDWKSKEGYEHSTGRVKIINGLLQIDGQTIDKNLFQE